MENLADIIRKTSRQEFGDFDGTDDIDCYGSSTSSNFQQQQQQQQRRCFPDWRRWRRMPPKILVSMATCKRVKESSVGMAPDPVQSLSNLLSVGEPSSPVKDIPMAKISVTSDPGFSPSMHRVIRNNLRTCKNAHILNY